MSPVSKISKGTDGKIEIRQLQAAEMVRGCVEFDGRSFADAYFEDIQTQQRFRVLAGCRREIFQPTFALFCLIFAPLMGLLEQNLPNYWAKTEHFGSLIVLSDKLLALNNIVAVDIGLYNSECWFRWVWMWESMEEADEAWSKAPADIGKTIEKLTQRINDFISDAKRNTKSERSKVSFDITPELKGIG